MKPIRALIVLEFPHVRDSLRTMVAAEKDIMLLGEYGDGASAVRAIRKHRPQLLFLGVQLRGMTGFEVLQSADGDRPPAVIFVSKFEHDAVRAFGSDAVDYLLKPFTRRRFKRALTRARSRLESSLRRDKPVEHSESTSKSAQLLAMKVSGRIVLLRPPEIEAIVACRTYSTVHTGNGTHRARSSLSAFQTKLPSGKFIRINRSTLINADHVKTILRKTHGDGLLRLMNGKEFPLSRRYRGQWAGLITSR